MIREVIYKLVRKSTSLRKKKKKKEKKKRRQNSPSLPAPFMSEHPAELLVLSSGSS